MEIISLGKPLEIAKENIAALIVNNIEFNITCTPGNLRELGIGFSVSEGLVKKDRLCVEVEGNIIRLTSKNSGRRLNRKMLSLTSSSSLRIFRISNKLPRVSAKENFTLEECITSLKYLETSYYKRTRGYHTAVLVGKNGMISSAYDVARHNSIDKVIGMAIEKKQILGEFFF